MTLADRVSKGGRGHCSEHRVARAPITQVRRRPDSWASARASCRYIWSHNRPDAAGVCVGHQVSARPGTTSRPVKCGWCVDTASPRRAAQGTCATAGVGFSRGNGSTTCTGGRARRGGGGGVPKIPAGAGTRGGGGAARGGEAHGTLRRGGAARGRLRPGGSVFFDGTGPPDVWAGWGGAGTARAAKKIVLSRAILVAGGP